MPLSKELVAASATPMILSVLGRGESYGYAIIQEIRDLSDRQIEWTDGMLYPVLHRLERQGLVERVTTDLAIYEAKSVPPQTTRAKLRGDFVRRAQERHQVRHILHRLRTLHGDVLPHPLLEHAHPIT